jgi:hypothetical protein
VRVYFPTINISLICLTHSTGRRYIKIESSDEREVNSGFSTVDNTFKGLTDQNGSSELQMRTN